MTSLNRNAGDERSTKLQFCENVKLLALTCTLKLTYFFKGHNSLQRIIQLNSTRDRHYENAKH